MPLVMFLDESIRQRLIGVGGYVLRLEDVLPVIAAWRELKAKMGLQAGDEIKWTMPANHPSRVKLDASGFTQAKKCPLIATTIAALPIKVLADCEGRVVAAFRSMPSTSSRFGTGISKPCRVRCDGSPGRTSGSCLRGMCSPSYVP